MSFTFVDDPIVPIDVEPVNKDGVRFYPIPGADKYYPSVTSITSLRTQHSSQVGERK